MNLKENGLECSFDLMMFNLRVLMRDFRRRTSDRCCLIYCRMTLSLAEQLCQLGDGLTLQ